MNRWHVLGYSGLLVVIFTLPIFNAYPSSYDDRESQAAFRLPLDGPVTVAWGGATSDVNYHVYLPDQRWAYDLLVARDGTTFRADGSRFADYYSYGLPVLAPASGRVFAAHDGEPEVAIGAPRWALAGLGNHVGIEVAPNEYLFIGHFQPGSVTVQVGDDVRAGQQIAGIGNSGNSSEPHIHLHLQDTPQPYFGEGIPFSFSRYERRGHVIERGMPRGGRRNGRYSGDSVAHVPERSAGQSN
ncbi:MAG: M23 family metallopeptidase [Planctomycetota bacterium]